jgi:hypothetical protein
MNKDSHRRYGEHLQKSENPGTDVIIAVQVMVEGPIAPGPPDHDKQINKYAQPT